VKTRHQGTIVCPVCQGQGKLSEDPEQYDFVTRDPQTNLCLICGGSGFIGPRKLLPDGRKAAELSFRPATRDTSLGATTQRKKQTSVAPDSDHAESPESPVGEFTFELHRRGIMDNTPSLASSEPASIDASPESPIEEIPCCTRVLEIDFRDLHFPSFFAQIRAHHLAERTWSPDREDDFVGGLLAHIDYLHNLLKEC